MIVIGQVAWLFLPEFTKRPRREIGGRTVCHFARDLPAEPRSVRLVVFAGWSRTQESDWMPFIIAAAIAALIWVWAFSVSHSKSAATFAWAAVCLSAPFVLNSRNLLPAALVDLFNTIRNLRAASLTALASGAPGLLFDQEFGIFPYAPVLLLGFRRALWNDSRPSPSRVFSRFDCRNGRAHCACRIAQPLVERSMMPGRTMLLAATPVGPTYRVALRARARAPAAPGRIAATGVGECPG